MTVVVVAWDTVDFLALGLVHPCAEEVQRAVPFSVALGVQVAAAGVPSILVE